MQPEKLDISTSLPSNYIREILERYKMKHINISTKTYPNMFAMVDDEDFEWLNQWKWRAGKDSNTFYASRTVSFGKNTKMHRQILGLTDPKIFGDHRDENGLNNTRGNLRICNDKENKCNRGKQKNNKSGFKGVYWGKKSKKWHAGIRINGKSIHLGTFFCLIKAAKAYDKAAIKYHGEFAHLNFERNLL